MVVAAAHADAAVSDRTASSAEVLFLQSTRGRNCIEQAVGKLKRFKRIALCEKTARNYGSFVALAFGLILIKSVHTAYKSPLTGFDRKPSHTSNYNF